MDILRTMTKNSKVEIDWEYIDPELSEIFNNLKNVMLAYAKYDQSI